MESRRMVQIIPICGAGLGMQTWRMDLWTQAGQERVEWIERVALTYVEPPCGAL